MTDKSDETKKPEALSKTEEAKKAKENKKAEKAKKAEEAKKAKENKKAEKIKKAEEAKKAKLSRKAEKLKKAAELKELKKGALVIEREVQPGEKIQHNGSIIFKTFVPDNVEVLSKDGGILLEQGGGNNLKLTAKGGWNTSTLVKDGTVKVAGASFVIETKVSVHDGVIFLDDQDVSKAFTESAAKAKFSGVISAAAIGNKAVIKTGSSVTLTDVGSDLKVSAEGFLDAHNIANDAHIKVSGSVDCNNLGADAHIEAHGAIHCADVAKNAKIHALGTMTANKVAENLDARLRGGLEASELGDNAYCEAGASVHIIGTVGVGSRIDAGGSIFIGHLKGKANLAAGGAVELDEHDEDVFIDTHAAVRLNWKKKKQGPTAP